MATSYPEPVVVGLIVVLGVLTFAMRFSFIALFGRLDDVPPGVERTLRFVPPAALAALALPALVTVDPETGGLAVDKLVAGGVGAAVAWRTENVLATLVAGMGVFWAVRFLL